MHKILKILDTLGLSVLDPIVRLICGEEPRLQVRRIGLFIVTPTVVFAVFLLAWGYVGPRHKTKSGEVPTPSVVLDAYGGIVEFHDREYTKLDDFEREGKDRELEIQEVKSRIEKVSAESEIVTTKFDEAESALDERVRAQIEPYQKAIAAQEADYAAKNAEREGKLKHWGDRIGAGDRESRSKFLKAVQLLIAEKEKQRQHVKGLKSELAQKRDLKDPGLEAVRRKKNSLDQELQYLKKRLTYLTDGNRSTRVAKAQERLKGAVTSFQRAESGEDLLALAVGIVQQDARITKIQESSYAKPPTFFDQVWTSVTCVFLGFLIASLIAIPIGVLCGLNSVVMASLMPLISLFKPVSPIVWLPIVFIIVGGFIAVPEEAWIAPAFLSSAITVALCCLWPTLVNTALGVASIQQDHMNVAKMLQLGLWSRLFKIVIPSALPLIFAGLRISLGVGWMVLIAGELLSSSPGLGKFVWDMFNNGSSETFAQMFVVVFWVGGIGFLLDRIMIVCQRLVSFDGAATSL
ncbi:MAG: ABC transporter permease subunit [Planctomycetota bacterium]